MNSYKLVLLLSITALLKMIHVFVFKVIFFKLRLNLPASRSECIVHLCEHIVQHISKFWGKIKVSLLNDG